MWEIKLKSESGFLSILPRYYSNTEFQVTQAENDYYIRAYHLDDLNDHKLLYEYGEELIRFLNISFKVTYQVEPKITSDGYYRFNEDGQREYLFHGLTQVSLPITINVYNLDNNLNSDWFVAWQNNANVRYAYHLISEEADWFSLYKIYETIRNDISPGNKNKGEKIIRGWSNSTKSFLKTANFHRHALYGKHSRKQLHPTSCNISITQAETYIRDIFAIWMDLKASSNTL